MHYIISLCVLLAYPAAVVALAASWTCGARVAKRAFFIVGVCLAITPLVILTFAQNQAF